MFLKQAILHLVSIMTIFVIFSMNYILLWFKVLCMGSPNWNMAFPKTFRWSVLKTGRYKKSTVGLFETVFNGNCMANKRCLSIQSSKMKHDLTSINTRHSIGGLFTWPWPLVCFLEHNTSFVPPKNVWASNEGSMWTRSKCRHKRYVFQTGVTNFTQISSQVVIQST